MKHSLYLHLLVFVNCGISYTACACAWPDVFQKSTWWDSDQGELVFSMGEMTGFRTLGYGQVSLDAWICQEESFANDGKILIRSKDHFVALGINWYAYVCMRFEAVTSVSYIYYILNAPNPNAGQHRQFINFSTDITIRYACDPVEGASGSEFVTIIKKGNESQAYIACPSVLLGRFEFSSLERCNSSTTKEIMEVCPENRRVTFDKLCQTNTLVYSTGDVFCVTSLSVGWDTFIQFFNAEPMVDNLYTYRFSCMAISSDSLGATVVYNNCTGHQTSTFVPRGHDGTIIGVGLMLTSLGPCENGTVSAGHTSIIKTSNGVMSTIPVRSGTSIVTTSLDTLSPTSSRRGIKEATTAVLMHPTNHKDLTSVVVGVVVSVSVGVAVVMLASFIYYRRRQKGNSRGTETLKGASENEDVVELSNLQDNCQEVSKCHRTYYNFVSEKVSPEQTYGSTDENSSKEVNGKTGSFEHKLEKVSEKFDNNSCSMNKGKENSDILHDTCNEGKSEDETSN